MSDYEAGYLQALKDVQASVRQVISHPGTTPDGMIFGIVSFLTDLIRTKERQLADPSGQDAPDPIGGSF